MEETTVRMYELGFLLVPTTPEGEVPARVVTLSDAITAAGGTVKSEGAPEFIDLAYRMEKNVASKKMKWTQGYFGWLKFQAPPETLEVLKKTLDGNTDLIRYILLKTNVENTIVFKKPKGVAVREPVQEESVEAFIDETQTDDMKEDHEKLPDLAADLDVATPAVDEETAKE